MSRGTGRCRIYDRRHEPHFVVFGNDRLSFSDLPPPAKQLLRRQSVSPRHARNRVAAALDLGDHPRLVLVAPSPPASRTGENLQPASRLLVIALSTVSILSLTVKAQAADSQIRTSVGR